MNVFFALALGAVSLYEQAIVVRLHEGFSGSNISYILIATPGGRLVDARWQDPDTPVPVGSLVKPFTALAYGETHAFRYPEHVCRGTASNCWLPGGHGRVGIVEAIAQSCNAYFDALAAELRYEDVATVAHRFSIAPPPERAPAAAYVGRSGLWSVSPAGLVRALAALALGARAASVARPDQRCSVNRYRLRNPHHSE